MKAIRTDLAIIITTTPPLQKENKVKEKASVRQGSEQGSTYDIILARTQDSLVSRQDQLWLSNRGLGGWGGAIRIQMDGFGVGDLEVGGGGGFQQGGLVLPTGISLCNILFFGLQTVTQQTCNMAPKL